MFDTVQIEAFTRTELLHYGIIDYSGPQNISLVNILIDSYTLTWEAIDLIQIKSNSKNCNPSDSLSQIFVFDRVLMEMPLNPYKDYSTSILAMIEPDYLRHTSFEIKNCIFENIKDTHNPILWIENDNDGLINFSNNTIWGSSSVNNFIILKTFGEIDIKNSIISDSESDGSSFLQILESHKVEINGLEISHLTGSTH